MYEAVNLVLDTHAEEVGTEGDLFAAQQTLKAGQAQISQNRQVQEADNTGLTKTKAELREKLIRKILVFSSGLMACATSNKNADLKTRANYTASELNKAADPVLIDIGTLLHTMALPLKADLTRYFIVETEYQEMEQLLAGFKLALPKRRVAANLTKVSTGNIDSVFKAQDRLLKEQMDALMLPFQFSRPDFYNAYRNARSIVDYAGRGKSASAAAPV